MDSGDRKTFEYPYKNGVYRHFKGNLYKVLTVGKDSETLETVVVYEALYDAPECRVWVRPLNMFFSEVVLLDGTKKIRFEFTNEIRD